MQNSVLQRIQSGLLEKRRNLTGWLSSAREPIQSEKLGTGGSQAIAGHLQVIDAALQQVEAGTLGVCQVCHDGVDSNLLEMDYTACICLEHFSQEDRSRLEAELEFLQNIQKAQLPQRPPVIPGLEVSAFSRPAQIVGGDYFDFLSFEDRSYGLAIADAMGHGVSASLLMGYLQSALRALLPESNSAAAVLRRANRIFLHNSRFTAFATTFLARYQSGERSLTYCNAGHNPPLLLRARTGQVEWLAPTGAALGLLEEYNPTERTVRLEFGDVLLLYTDGVTEATNPQDQPYGSARLEAIAHQNAGLSTAELLGAVRQDLASFIGDQPLEDDITFVMCKQSA